MDITFFGQSSFRLRGKSATVVTDPFKPDFIGLKFPKVEADIVTVSHDHQDHNFVAEVEGAPFIISCPGEYEIKGVSVFGYDSYHDNQQGANLGKNIVFLIEIDDLRICHLGDLGTSLDAKTLEEIGNADILCVPVGNGKYTLDTEAAVDLIKQIQPPIVIPMHYQIKGMNEDLYQSLCPVDKFMSKMGVEERVFLDKLSITKDKLPEETKVILLEKKS